MVFAFQLAIFLVIRCCNWARATSTLCSQCVLLNDTLIHHWASIDFTGSYSTVQEDFHQPAHPRGRFLRAPRNPAHLSAYNPTAEYFNPAADCGGSAEDPPVTCIIPPRVCRGFPMKSNDVIMIDRYSYAKTKGNTKCTCSALHLDFI